MSIITEYTYDKDDILKKINPTIWGILFYN